MTEFSADPIVPRSATRHTTITAKFRTGESNRKPVGIWDRRRAERYERLVARAVLPRQSGG